MLLWILSNIEVRCKMLYSHQANRDSSRTHKQTKLKQLKWFVTCSIQIITKGKVSIRVDLVLAVRKISTQQKCPQMGLQQDNKLANSTMLEVDLINWTKTTPLI
jgi:hypothetical protein